VCHICNLYEVAETAVFQSAFCFCKVMFQIGAELCIMLNHEVMIRNLKWLLDEN
jgi:hypothetical protein